MTTNNTELFIYTPSEILEIAKNRLEGYNGYLNGQNFFVGVRGVLGAVQPSSYKIYYKVPLRDSAGSIVLIDIPKSLGEIRAYQQKEIIVYGFLRSNLNLYNNSLSFFIQASRIEPVVQISEEVKEQETTLMGLLTSHQRDFRHFPDLEAYNITVIHGMTSDVKADFERQLSQDTAMRISYMATNITSAESLRQAIESAEGDIVVVIRGGGSDGQFEVFNDYELVKAWTSKNAYKISALGHSKDRTLFDTFATQSCDTPTAAGAFIRKSIDALKAQKRIEELTAQHKKEMEEVSKEYASKLEEHQKAKEADVKAIMEKLEGVQKERELLLKEVSEKIASKDQELAGKLQEVQKEFAHKLEAKESELRQMIERLTKKDSQLKVTIIVAVVAVIVMLGVLFYSLS